MRRIARSRGGRDLDTSWDYVYTDLNSVRRFAEEFLASVVPADGRSAVTAEQA